MHQLNNKIKTIESKWLDILISFNQEKFKNVGLSSHNEEHHLRVWCFVKEIIKTLNATITFNEKELESLIIATFFHDLGMVRTRDVSHGHESRRFCESFFSSNNFPRPDKFEETLKIIEKHDDKDYKNTDSQPTLLSILAMADDLDAFGLIGAVRYAEIYLLRDIALDQLPQKVIFNAQRRFHHLKRNLKEFPDFLGIHQKRYESLLEFYRTAQRYEPVIKNIHYNIEKSKNYKLIDLIEPAYNSTVKEFRNQLQEELREFILP